MAEDERGAQVRIGTSGWSYPGWRGGPASYLSWAAQTPADFTFAVKGGRFITHRKRLRDVRLALANFFASGLLGLEGRLGPVLWQLPTGFRPELPLLESFLEALPRTVSEAAAMARGHDPRFADQVLTDVGGDGVIRHALEVRSDLATDPDLVALLRASCVASVVSDGAERWPLANVVTSDFVYVRLHGSRELYVSGYRADELDTWASRIRRWQADGLDAFVYFDNDADGHAPRDALALRRRLEPVASEGPTRH